LQRFARRVYGIAGIYGLLVLTPQYFLEERIGRDAPPPITHPEYFYGFVGLALVWQLAFLLIASDPERYRPLMPITVLEKLAFGVPVMLLYANDRVTSQVLAFGMLDLSLGVLFTVAYLRLRPAASSTRAS
jgi:uncharacterized membrane protein YuzA (DUF378 family)